MSNFIAAGSVPQEGGKIFLLVPGKKPLWLSPQLWEHICRVEPYWASLPGSPFYEVQIMELNAMIQPDDAPASVRVASLAEADGPQDRGVTLADVPALAHLVEAVDA